MCNLLGNRHCLEFLVFNRPNVFLKLYVGIIFEQEIDCVVYLITSFQVPLVNVIFLPSTPKHTLWFCQAGILLLTFLKKMKHLSFIYIPSVTLLLTTNSITNPVNHLANVFLVSPET